MVLHALLVLAAVARADAPTLAPLPPAMEGRADAPMTLTLFGNFACPNTARLVKHGVVDELLRRHPRTLKLEFRHFSKPHPEGVPAAARWDAVRRIAPQAAWSYFSGLFDCRLAKDLTPACMARLETKLGMDTAALDAASSAAAAQARAAQSADDDAAARASVNGTPTLLLDGTLLIDGAPGPGCPAGDAPCEERLAASFRSFTDMLDASVIEREKAVSR